MYNLYCITCVRTGGTRALSFRGCHVGERVGRRRCDQPSRPREGRHAIPGSWSSVDRRGGRFLVSSGRLRIVCRSRVVRGRVSSPSRRRRRHARYRRRTPLSRTSAPVVGHRADPPLVRLVGRRSSGVAVCRWRLDLRRCRSVWPVVSAPCWARSSFVRWVTFRLPLAYWLFIVILLVVLIEFVLTRPSGPFYFAFGLLDVFSCLCCLI